MVTPNFNGHLFNLTQYESPPRSHILSNGSISGLDGEIFNLICEKLNVNYKIVGPTGPPENWITNSVYDLFNGTAEINFNSRLFLSDYYTNSAVTPIHPYEIDSVVILVPKGKAYPSYMNLIQPFSLISWMSLIVMFITFVISWRFINLIISKVHLKKMSRHFCDFLLDVVRLQFCTSLNRQLDCSTERLFILGFTIYSFMVLVGYQTVLVAFMTSPRFQPDMNNFNDLNKSEVKIAVPELLFKLKKWISAGDIRLNNRFIRSNLSIWNLKAHPKTIERGNLAFLCISRDAKLFLRSSANIYKGREILHLIPQGLLYSVSSYTARNGSKFTNRIEQLLLRIREVGLMDYLVTKSYSDVEKIKKLVEVNKARRTLGLVELQAAFIFLSLGYFMSTCIFVLEKFREQIISFYRKFGKIKLGQNRTTKPQKCTKNYDYLFKTKMSVYDYTRQGSYVP